MSFAAIDIGHRWPEPGEVWRNRHGHHYLVTGRSTHAETQETLVVCRACAAPYRSLAYPLSSFSGSETNDPSLQLELIEF